LSIGRRRKALVLRHLLAAVPRQRAAELVRKTVCLLDQRSDHGPAVTATNLRQQHITRVPLDQGDDVAVRRAAQSENVVME
jgi:hypothetical protein